MQKLIAFGKKVFAWFLGRKGRITTGVVGGAFTLLTVFVFVFCSVYHGDPGLFQTEEFHGIRTQTIANGTEISTETTSAANRAETYFEVRYPSGVYYRVIKDQSASDFYELAFDNPWEIGERKFLLRPMISCASLTSSINASYPFSIEVRLLTLDGKTPQTAEGLYSAVRKFYLFDTRGVLDAVEASNRHGLLDEEEWVQCQNTMDALAMVGISNFSFMAESVGFVDGNAFVQKAADVHGDLRRLYYFSFSAIPFSVIAVLSLSAFFGCTIAAVSKKRKGETVAAIFDPTQEKEDIPEIEGARSEAYSEKRPPRSAAISAFLDRHHIHPFLGEWFFRATGLLFVAVSSLCLSLIAEALLDDWGAGWIAFNDAWGEVFRVFSSLGNIMLVVVVVGVITETRKNLNISTWFFLTLSAVYYVVSCSALFSVEISGGKLGSFFADQLAPTLPGNVFLGIGLFTILGFFLFYEPPERVINRVLFRCLSVIPIAIAIISVLFTYQYESRQYTPSYWLRNFLFIRSSNVLFIGVLYEISVYFFYLGMARRRGEKKLISDTVTPAVQFQKNVALCILIGLLVLIFYLIPVDQRDYFGLDTEHAFYYVLIPFFLFFHPSGRAHKDRDEIIYYALYAVAWVLPSLPRIVNTVGSLLRLR